MIMSIKTTRCSSHVHQVRMGAHAGETGLRKYQVARMVHQRFKDRQGPPEGSIQLHGKRQPKVHLINRQDGGDREW